MRKIFISSLMFVLVLIGCNKDECDPVTIPVDDRESFEISFLDYSDNNFFIDPLYSDTSSQLNIYNLYYGSVTPTVRTKYFVKKIELYKSINTIYEIGIIARAYINLPSRTYNNLYPDYYRDFNVDTAGLSETARFRLLNEGSEYTFNPMTGQINFHIVLEENSTIAAAYILENDSLEFGDDLYYGEFIAELVNNSKTIGVLKLIKPMNLQPGFISAWKNKLKNVYQIRDEAAPISDLDFDIFLKKADGSDTNKFGDKRLLELFGFDKFNESGEAIPDGKFDRRIGINYDPKTSQLFFPVLQPFGFNIPITLNEFKYQAIYDTLKNYLTLPGNHFVIRGKFKPLWCVLRRI